MQIPWNKGKTGCISDEQKSKISAATKARGPQSEELKAKRSAAMMGKNKGKSFGPWSEERKEERRRTHWRKRNETDY
jgi:hypothetical protein